MIKQSMPPFSKKAKLVCHKERSKTSFITQLVVSESRYRWGWEWGANNLLDVLELATTGPGLGHVVTQHTSNVVTAEGRLAKHNKLESVLRDEGDVLAGTAVTVGGVHCGWVVWFLVCVRALEQPVGW